MLWGAFAALVLALFGVTLPALPETGGTYRLVESAAMTYGHACGEAELVSWSDGKRTAGEVRIRWPDGACPVERIAHAIRHERGHQVCWLLWADRSEACAEHLAGVP